MFNRQDITEEYSPTNRITLSVALLLHVLTSHHSEAR